MSIVKKYGKNLTGFCRCNSGNISGLVLTIILIKFDKSFGKLHGGEISLLVPEEEISRRRESWVRPSLKEAKGCLNIYARMCRPAEEGGAMQPWELDA